MNDLKSLRSLLDSGTPGLRLGTVESVLDAARIVVRFSTGARRKVYGQAPEGAQVVVRADQLVSRVSAPAATTLTIR